jgi:hypothetical protein
MHLKVDKVPQLQQFSKFQSAEEFHRHMELWLTQHKRDLTKCELVGLKYLVRFSEKTPGVCYESIGTVLKAIHQEYYDHGISRASFKRMIKKTAKLGILTVYETARENGAQSSNLYVFNRFNGYEQLGDL